ncbi:hypothetical protein [Nocardia paucivorans]|uniref:hypothetical protein n=1 Tax=Nocardia paucivorans TaxID=114259 RepID=UPI000316ED3E|nr:hypothetical protein [Nocardia paucivorans]
MAGQGEDGSGGDPDIPFVLNAVGEPTGDRRSSDAERPHEIDGIRATGRPAAPDNSPGLSKSAESARAAKAPEPTVVESNEEVDDAAAENASAPDTARSADARDALERIVDRLLDVAPPGWDRLYAELSVTVSAWAARAVFTVDGVETVVDVPRPAVESVREYRAATAVPGSGTWWRLVLHVTADGDIEAEYDHGDRPFPGDQLLGSAAYRADLKSFPRDRLPVWLAAYIGHDGRQTRSPHRAVVMARADRAASIWSELVENEFPPFPAMWARWTALAAAFTAAGSERGPRMLPALGWFESSRRSGATLCALPGDRAVLSGGVWDDPMLDAVYNRARDMPNFYAGAPEWVADPVLNPRAASGLLSFCYWWENGHWYRGESPPAQRCAFALPGIRTADTVVDIITRVVSRGNDSERSAAIATLVDAAESGAVTEETVLNAFGADGVDMGAALFQFRIAGLLVEKLAAMPEKLALTRVRQYLGGHGLDAPGYSMDELVTERLDCGWMVYAPGPSDEFASDRPIFCIADDGVLEISSSAVAPKRFVAQFEQRFRRRRQAGDDRGISGAGPVVRGAVGRG